MRPKPKAFLFDKDGTLLDFTATYGPAIPHVAADLLGEASGARFESLVKVLGYDITNNQFFEDSFLIAGSTADYADDIAHAAGLTTTDAFVDRIDELFRRFALPHVTAFDGVHGFLDDLITRGLPLGIATNDAELNAHMQLDASGLNDRFGFVAGYDSGFGGKPDPGQITAFAGHLGIEPADVAMVGDSLHDLSAARAVGALAIGVCTGFSKPDELAPQADILVQSFADIPNHVDLPPTGA